MSHITALYKGHDPHRGEHGTDLLLTEYSDGHRELAMRDGKDQAWTTWSPPVALRVEERMPEDRRGGAA